LQHRPKTPTLGNQISGRGCNLRNHRTARGFERFGGPDVASFRHIVSSVRPVEETLAVNSRTKRVGLSRFVACERRADETAHAIKFIITQTNLDNVADFVEALDETAETGDVHDARGRPECSFEHKWKGDLLGTIEPLVSPPEFDKVQVAEVANLRPDVR